MKTTITLTQKNSAAIAIDALPRLKLLAMASARLRQTEQPVKVGMTVTHKSYGAGKVVGEWGSIRSGVPCKDIFDVIFQNRSGRPFLHCCRKEYLTPDPLYFPRKCCDASCTNTQRREASPESRPIACSDLLGSAVSVIAVAVELQELVRNLPQVVEQLPGRTAGSLGGASSVNPNPTAGQVELARPR
jgi:hypothetical protein